MLTAVVLTLNEDNILDESLKALSFADEILVLDSGSSDNSVNIAKGHGARVVHREFDNYANQRNFALNLVKEGWILMVDADEIVEEDLKKEILSIITSKLDNALYVVRRKDYFLGKWLRYAGFYPTWLPRLFKAGEVVVQRSINEEYVTNGSIGRLRSHLIHFPFNKGVKFWYERHVKYAYMEAKLLAEDQRDIWLGVRNLFSQSKLDRRKGLKSLSFFLPFRWIFVWFYLVFIKLGFLDGRRGLLFISMRITYEKMIIDIWKSLKQGKEYQRL